MFEDTLVLAVESSAAAPAAGATSGNGNTDDGRDHWPYCYMACIAGQRASAAPCGKSDATPGPARDARDPIEPLATIYHACINPATIVYNHLNQPRELVKAEAVTKLFA